MWDNNKKDEIKTDLQEADLVRVEQYWRMLDRLMIYSLASRVLQPNEIQDVIRLWDTVVKKSIDMDATVRTEYLEGTQQGRAAKYQNEPDGEMMRLHLLKQLELAKKIACLTFKQSDEDPPALES